MRPGPHKSLRDRVVPGVPIWITETAQAACGGSPWAVTFIDRFRTVARQRHGSAQRRQLGAGRDDRIPAFRPQRLQGSRVMVAPASIAFIATPQVRNPRCQ
jgi:hypothetical protein